MKIRIIIILVILGILIFPFIEKNALGINNNIKSDDNNYKNENVKEFIRKYDLYVFQLIKEDVDDWCVIKFQNGLYGITSNRTVRKYSKDWCGIKLPDHLFEI